MKDRELPPRQAVIRTKNRISPDYTFDHIL